MQRDSDLCSVCRVPADAAAVINGSEGYGDIYGRVLFYSVPDGVYVRAEVTGLPKGVSPCGSPVFAFHIHGGESCTGDEDDPFANAGTHYDPAGCPHPHHAGDLPPLFGVRGKAFTLFLTDRFTVPEILGKTVVIHSSPDDFTTQPSGNAGEKIACGVIRPRAR